MQTVKHDRNAVKHVGVENNKPAKCKQLTQPRKKKVKQ